MIKFDIMVLMTDDAGDHTNWGDEIGTAEFYTVEHTIMSYLG